MIGYTQQLNNIEQMQQISYGVWTMPYLWPCRSEWLHALATVSESMKQTGCILS